MIKQFNKKPSILVSILCFFMMINFSISYAQKDAQTFFKKENFIAQKDSLFNLFGNNKTFIPKLELQALIALSYYPELKDVKIIFKRKKLNTTMAAKPTNFSAFKRIGKRTYLIHLNDYPESVNIPFDSASFNAQVGVIGHELAHIAYYEYTSAWKILGLAFKYTNKKFRINFEKDTDKRAINHGLGWQLYAFKLYVRNYPHAPEEYRAYKAKIYLSAPEAKELTLQYFKNENYQ